MEDFKLKMNRGCSIPFEIQPPILNQIKEIQANIHYTTYSSTKKGLYAVLATCRDKRRNYLGMFIDDLDMKFQFEVADSDVYFDSNDYE